MNGNRSETGTTKYRNQENAPIRFILEKESTRRYTNNSMNWSRLELGLIEIDHKLNGYKKKTKNKKQKRKTKKGQRRRKRKRFFSLNQRRKKPHRDESGIRYKQDKISIMRV